MLLKASPRAELIKKTTYIQRTVIITGSNTNAICTQEIVNYTSMWAEEIMFPNHRIVSCNLQKITSPEKIIDSNLLPSCKHELKITKQQAVHRTASSNSLILPTTPTAKWLECGPNHLLMTCASSLKCGSTEGIFMTQIQVGSYMRPQISLPISNTTFMLKIIVCQICSEDKRALLHN